MGTQIHVLTNIRHNTLHIAGDSFKCALILSKLSRDVDHCLLRQNLESVKLLYYECSLPQKRNPNNLETDIKSLMTISFSVCFVIEM